MRAVARKAVTAGIYLAAFVAFAALIFCVLTIGHVAAEWGPLEAKDRLLASCRYAFMGLLIGWCANASDAFFKKRGIGRYRR